MKFAFCNELLGNGVCEEGLRLASEIGYEGVEVAPFTICERADLLDEEFVRSYRKSAEKNGLQVIGLHWLLAKTDSFHLTTDDLKVRAQTSTYFTHLIKLCSLLGGSIMVLGSPLQRNFPATMDHEQAMENAIATLRPIFPTLEEHKVVLAIEPLGPQEGNFLNHARQAREMIERIDSEFVRLHLDVKAMSSEGSPIPEIICKNADLLHHFHANDPNRLGPGMGDVDQRPIFQSLKEIDYRRWVSVEVFDYAPGVEKILCESWNAMQNAISESSIQSQ